MLSLEDVTGRLKVVEDRVETVMTLSGSKPLLIKEWAACMSERRSDEGSSSCGGDGKHRGKTPQKKDSDDVSRSVDKDMCRHCGKTGHWARDCKNPKEKEQAHLM
jgi:hypothetical protein